MKRTPWLKASIALVFACACVAAGAQTADGLDQRIAALYAQAADEAAIDRDHALGLLDVALEFNPFSSDALFLRGWLLRDEQALTRGAESDLRRALAADTFDRASRAEAAVTLAEILIRSDRAAEAAPILFDISAVDLGANEAVAARLLACVVRWAREAGNDDAVQNALADARDQFPNDPVFFVLDLDREPDPSYRYRRELERLLRVHRVVPGDPDAASNELLEAVLSYAVRAPVQADRTWAFDLYRNLGGSNPASVLAVAASADHDVAAIFAELDGYTRKDVFEDLLGAVPETVRDQMLAASLAFNGVSVSDHNGDGFWDERLTVRDGSVERWEQDANQDGVVELDLVVSGGEPAAVWFAVGGTRASGLYGRYPALDEVVIPLPGGSMLYTLTPFAVNLPVLQDLPAGGPTLTSRLDFPGAADGLEPSVFRDAAISISERNGAGVAVSTTVFSGGVPVRRSLDRDGDGHPDELVVFEGGLPASAIRDIDADGYYEVAVTYEAGREAATVIDEDDNGIPDVTELSVAGGLREWDLNQDGSIDVREFGIWTDTLRQEFGSAGLRR